MNRLKYIFRVHVPHRVSSNTAQPFCKYHSGSCCKRRSSKLRFNKSNKFLSSARETLLSSYYLAGAQYKEKVSHKYGNGSRKSVQTCPQESSKHSSIRISPEDQKRPLENNRELSCCSSTWETSIRNNVTIKTLQNNTYETNDAHNGFGDWREQPKNWKSNCNLAENQTEVRTYAQMIADYSELMYVKQSAIPPRMYIIEKNTLDGLQKAVTKDRNADSGKLLIDSTSLRRDIRPARSRSPGSFGQSVRFNSGGPPHQFDRLESSDYEATKVLSNPVVCTSTDEGKESRSYAKMISDYSAALYTQASSYLATPKTSEEEEAPRKDSLESVWMMSKEKNNPDATEEENADIGPSEFSSYSPNNSRDHEKCKSLREEKEPEMPSDLKFKAESKHPKLSNQTTSATDYSDFKDFQKISVADLLDNINEPKWLQRTVGSHKLETIAIDPANPLKHSDNLSAPNTVHSVHHPTALASDAMEAKQGGSSGSIPNMSNPGGQGAHTSTTTTKKPPRHPTAAAPTHSIRPQVELQMAASSSGSVVSINVDSVKSLGAMNAAEGSELLVVVRSNKGNSSATQSDGKQLHSGGVQKSGPHAGHRADYGPMRFSIAEESAPVKQIEFSINGQPASEVKSITALAEKLDVVSSTGALEVRVPFSRNAAAGQASAGGMAKNVHAMGPVLNLRILAKFDRSVADRTADLTAKTPKVPKDAPKPKTPEPPKTHYVFKTPIGQDDKKTKLGNLNIPNKDNKGGGGKSGSGNTAPPGVVGRVPGGKGPQGGFKASESELWKEGSESTVDVTRDINSAALTYANERVSDTSGTTDAKNEKVNPSPETADERIPSKMIPWWSSDDAFSNIRKVDDPKEAQGSQNKNVSSYKVGEIEKVEAADSSVSNPENSDTGVGTGNALFSQVRPGEKKIESVTLKAERASEKQEDKPDVCPLVWTKPSDTQNTDAMKLIKTEVKNDPDQIEVKDHRTPHTKVPLPTKIAEKLDKNTTYTLLNPNAVDQKDEAKQKQVQLKAWQGDLQEPTKVNQQNVKVELKKENDAVKTVQKSSAGSGTILSADHASTNNVTMSGGSVDKKNSIQSNVSSKVPVPETKQLPESKIVKEMDDSYAKLIRETKYTEKKNRMVSETSQGKKFKPVDATESKQLISTNVTLKRMDATDSQDKITVSKNVPTNPKQEKNVFDSIRPIEKRKDGTLIDFGVKVSSRGKPEKYRIRLRPDRDAVSFSKKLKEASAAKLKQSEKTSKNDVTVHVRGTASKEQKEPSKSASSDKSPTNTSKLTDNQGKSGNSTKSPKHDKDGKPSGSVKFTTYAPQTEETLTTYKDAVQQPRSASVDRPRKSFPEGTVVQPTMKQLTAKTTKPAPTSKIPTSVSNKNVKPVTPSTLQRSANTSDSPLKGTIVVHPANQLQSKAEKSMSRSSEFTPYDDFGQHNFAPFAGTIINARPLSEKKSETFPLAGTVAQPNKRWHKKPTEVQSPSSMKITKESKTQLFNNIGTDQTRFSTDARGPGTSTGGESSGIVNCSNACPDYASDTSTDFSSMNGNADPPDDPSSFAQGRSKSTENETQTELWHEGPSATANSNISHTHLPCTDTPSDMFHVNATDRPEKNLLYSIWLQRFKDVNQSV